ATVDVAATGFVQGVSISDDATADFPVYDLGFTVELTADPMAADIGATVNFTLTLTNTGTSPLFLPPASQDPVTTGRLDNPTAPDVLGDLYATLNTVCFSSGSLAPGASCVLAYNDPALTNDELTYIIDQTDPATITFLVGITLWSDQANPAFEIANQDTVEITVNQPVVPAINAFGLAANPNPGAVGNQIVFTASIQNSGTQVLTNLTATLQLTQLSFTNAVGDNGGIVLTGGHNQTPLPTITMVINDADGTLNPGEVATATGYWVADRVGSFRATLTATGRAGTTQATATDTELLEFRINSSVIATATPITPGAITPTATTATTDPDGNPLDPNALDPTITKTVTPESALPGQDVTYTVTITNGSTTAMANVTVTDNMPLELTINNATTSVGASVVSGQLITVTTGQLNPGQRITVVIIARVNDDVSIPSLITNDACAAVTGRTQVCASVELPIGADAEALPTTGQGEPESVDLDIATQGVAGVASRPFGVAPLLMLGLLALLSTGQINRQRWLLGGLAVLIIATIAGALVLVGSGDEKDDTTGTPQVVLPPGVTPTASPTLDRAPTLTPLATEESLESPVAPTPLDAPPTLRPSPTPYIP
ncbi:MAG: isopeptide-forming domain-containing fimbrial protein, partial [Anaerolineae bacterium]